MNAYQIALLTAAYIVFLLAVLLLNRGSDLRLDWRIKQIEQQKKGINWPASN